MHAGGNQGGMRNYYYPARACAAGVKESVCRRRRRRRRRWHKNRWFRRSGHLCVLLQLRIGRYLRKTGCCTLEIAEDGLLALQIIRFLFSMPVVYRPHPAAVPTAYRPATCTLFAQAHNLKHKRLLNVVFCSFIMDLRRERKLLLKVREQQEAEIERIQATKKRCNGSMWTL